jgi:hypothetical protein
LTDSAFEIINVIHRALVDFPDDVSGFEPYLIGRASGLNFHYQ